MTVRPRPAGPHVPWRLRLIGAAALELLGVAFAAQAVTANPVAANPVAVTRAGAVGGVDADGVDVYRGIPYAAAPVGALRWTPPQPASSWTGVRPATAFAAHCAQGPGVGGFSSASESEDCLYLNVFTPAGATALSRPLPVMAWIPGGGFRVGESDDYDGSALARDGGVVVVSFNYRLGLLGFFAHPAVRAGGAGANFGLLDQQAALRWVRDNIAAFGGDPGNVTLFGESAGADSVVANLLSPGAQGLFGRAIAESSAYVVQASSLEQADAKAQRFAAAAGCPGQSAACLRDLPIHSVLRLQGPYVSQLIIDGVSLPEPLDDAFRAGRFAHVPVLNGTNREEYRFYVGLARLTGSGSGLVGGIADGMRRARPDLDAVVREHYAAPGADTVDATARALTDALFACPALKLDRWLAAAVPVFAYEFDDAQAPQYTGAPDYRMGASHTSELQYLFPGFRGASGARQPLSPDRQALSADMIRSWTTFARTGRPWEGSSNPQGWRPFESSTADVVPLAPRGVEGSSDFAAEHQCSLWN